MFLELLIGMIASGKSTWTGSRAVDGALVSNDDAWVTAIHGGNYTLYSKQLKPLYKSFEHNVIAVAATLQRDVIIDRTNLSRRMRARYIAIAKSLDIPVVGVIFPIATPEIHADRRIKSDSRGHDIGYWTRVCQEHLKEYEPPTIEEGFDSLVPADVAQEMRLDGCWSATGILNRK